MTKLSMDTATVEQTSATLGDLAADAEARRMDKGLTTRCEQGRAHAEVGRIVFAFIEDSDRCYLDLAAVLAALSDKLANAAAVTTGNDQEAASRFLDGVAFTPPPPDTPTTRGPW